MHPARLSYLAGIQPPGLRAFRHTILAKDSPIKIHRNIKEDLPMAKFLDEVLDANKQYANTFDKDLAMPPARRFAILTCGITQWR